MSIVLNMDIKLSCVVTDVVLKLSNVFNLSLTGKHVVHAAGVAEDEDYIALDTGTLDYIDYAIIYLRPTVGNLFLSFDGSTPEINIYNGTFVVLPFKNTVQELYVLGDEEAVPFEYILVGRDA